MWHKKLEPIIPAVTITALKKVSMKEMNTQSMMKEMNTQSNIPYWVVGQDFADTLMEDANEEEIPKDDHVDDLGQVLKDAQRDCENENENAKLHRMI
jgi:hypothetical protein